MVQECFVKDCCSKWSMYSKSNKVAFFQFPTDSKCKNAWVQAIYHLNNQKNVDQINSHTRVCEKHFEYDNLIRHNCRTTLSKGSVPTIFPMEQYSEAEFLIMSDDEMTEFSNPCTEKPAADYEKLMRAEKSTSNERTNNITVTTDIKTAGHVLYVCEHCGHSNSIEVSNIAESATINSDSDVLMDKVTREMEEFALSPIEIDVNQDEGKDTITLNSITDCMDQEDIINRQSDSKRNFSESFNEESVLISTPNQSKKRRLIFPGNIHLTPKSSKHLSQNEGINKLRGTENVGVKTPTSIPKQIRKRRLFFPGDVNDNEELTPKSSRKFISSLKNVVNKQRIKIRNAQQKIRRKQKTILYP